MEPWDRGECIAHIPSSMKNGTPGPGKYNTRPKFKGQTAPIKMKGRHELPTDTNKAPYYNLPSTVGNTTKINMHSRTETRASYVTPGPSYVPPAFGSDARKVGISPPVFNTRSSKSSSSRRSASTALGRRRNPDETPGPGPGKYSTRTEPSTAHGVRIKGSHDFRYQNTDSPGPAAYKPRYEKVIPSAPKYGIKGRHNPKDRESTPGYRNLGSTLGGPRYSMKARANDDICII